LITLSFVVNVSSSDQSTMELKINEYCRLIKLEGFPQDAVLMAIQRLKARIKFYPTWLEIKDEIETCLYAKSQKTGQSLTGNEMLTKLYALLPAEVDRWQAEVNFCAVHLKFKPDTVEIHTEKAPAVFMATKYGGYMRRIFKEKSIFFVSPKGATARV
jgi:hypothetical protein